MLAIRIGGMSGWPLRALQPSNFCLEGALFHQLGVNLSRQTPLLVNSLPPYEIGGIEGGVLGANA